MNKSVVTIATATSFLLAGGIAQASVKIASVKPAKVTSKSTSVKGTATKSATIRLSRYNTTYAYGKATSKGKFSFKLKHKLHAGWSYRLTVSKKGYKTTVKHLVVKTVGNKNTVTPEVNSNMPANNIAPSGITSNPVSTPQVINTKPNQNISSADGSQNTTDTPIADTDPNASKYPDWLEKKNRNNYDKLQAEIETNNSKIQSDSDLISELTNQKPQAQKEYDDFMASIQAEVTAKNGGYTTEQLTKKFELADAITDTDKKIANLNKEITEAQIDATYLRHHLLGLDPNSWWYGY